MSQERPRRIPHSERTDAFDQIREILLGDILAEIEHRLARLDSYIANRNNEVQHDVRKRTDVLEAHVRKELDALGKRLSAETTDTSNALRTAHDEQRDAVARIEQRVRRLEEHVDASVARVEREMREQMLAQAKSFLEELERMRQSLRVALVRELGLEPSADEGAENGGSWASTH